MSTSSHLTTGQIASIFHAPEWRIRRVVDALDVELPRAGQYRLVPRELLVDIGAELRKRQSPKKEREAAGKCD